MPTSSIPPGTSLLRVLDRHWFYFALGMALALGWLVPAWGHWMDDIGMMPYLVAFAFFLNGLALSMESLLGNLRHWRLLLLSLLNIFIVPLLVTALALRLLPGVDSTLQIGFLMLAVMPTTLVSAVVLTRIAGGNGALALYITVLANVLAVMLVPVLMRASLPAIADQQIALWGTVWKLVYTVLLPTVGGQALRVGLHAWADRHRRALGVVSQVSLLLFVINGMAALPHHALSPALWGGVLLAGTLLHLLLLGVAEGAGRLFRLDLPTRRAFSLSTSEKSLAVAVALSKQLFPALGGMVLFPAIVYYVAQLIIDNLLAYRWGRDRHAAPSVETR